MAPHSIVRLAMIGAALCLSATCVIADDSPGGVPSTAPSAAATSAASYRIKSVIIPPDSAWRQDNALNHPPSIYIVVKKDGTQIGDDSDHVRGWEVEFPENSEDYYWIDGDDSTSYTVEVWDHHNWSSDQMIVSIIKLKMQDFEKPIHEHLSAIDPPDRAVQVEFELKK